MNIREQYATLKMQIKDIEDKLAVLAPQIKKELEGVEDMKIKEDYGSFTIVPITRYKYAESFKKKIKEMQNEEIVSKRAEAVYTEELRYTPARIGPPVGGYNFDKYFPKK